MSVQSEITRITSAKSQIATAISNKGVTVPNGALISEMAELIEDIPTGENLDTVIMKQRSLINELSTVLDNKAAGGSGGGSFKTCTVNVGAGFFYYTAGDGTQKSAKLTANDVLCNSFITTVGGYGTNVSAENATLLNVFYYGIFGFRVDAPAGGVVTITYPNS